MESIVQSQTLYINNINEKVKKPVLKKMLYMVFSQYGKVIEISASRGLKLKGQAWVVFDNAISATNALRGKQGFNFYGKPLKIAFGKTKSNIVARKETLVASQTSRSNKRGRDESDQNSNSEHASKRGTGQSNNVLFAQDLSPQTTSQALTSLFQQLPGFVEVRVPPGDVHQGTAFIEFSDDVSASMALKQMNGFSLSSDDKLNLSFSQ